MRHKTVTNIPRVRFSSGPNLLSSIPCIKLFLLVYFAALKNLSYNGIYTMTDGHTFQGRKRSLSEHRKIRKKLGLASSVLSSDDYIPPLGLLEKCTLLDKMPLAFCVIELVFDEKGHGVDFVFRYCNEMMADVEGIPISEMINRSFYEVFENGDKSGWLHMPMLPSTATSIL